MRLAKGRRRALSSSDLIKLSWGKSAAWISKIRYPNRRAERGHVGSLPTGTPEVGMPSATHFLAAYRGHQPRRTIPCHRGDVMKGTE